MTALRPIESRNVVAVASEEYPINEICAVPGCAKSVDTRPDGTPTAHHCFSRSKIHSKSYYVSINDQSPIPHAVGLCGSGTTGHHGDVEEQRAWIRYEDGIWNWYERREVPGSLAAGDPPTGEWALVGPLDPQPGPVAARATKNGSGGKKAGGVRSKKVYSINIPASQQEQGSASLRELIQTARERYKAEMGWKDNVPDYWVILSVLAKDAQS